MYCRKCGSQVNERASACPYCGEPTRDYVPAQNQAQEEDSGSFGWALLGFLIPIVGLILYLVWKDSKPKCAKRAGKGALASFIVNVVVWVIYFIAVVAMVGAVL